MPTSPGLVEALDLLIEIHDKEPVYAHMHMIPEIMFRLVSQDAASSSLAEYFRCKPGCVYCDTKRQHFDN